MKAVWTLRAGDWMAHVRYDIQHPLWTFALTYNWDGILAFCIMDIRLGEGAYVSYKYLFQLLLWVFSDGGDFCF